MKQQEALGAEMTANDNKPLTEFWVKVTDLSKADAPQYVLDMRYTSLPKAEYFQVSCVAAESKAAKSAHISCISQSSAARSLR